MTQPQSGTAGPVEHIHWRSLIAAIAAISAVGIAMGLGLEDTLVKAMDVAGDHLVAEYGGRKAKQRAAHELAILKDLEASPAEPRDRCAALWTLLKAGDDTPATKLLAAAAEAKASAAKSTDA